ncbi:MAG: cation:proton antiporter [Microthrixaceae bacterium]
MLILLSLAVVVLVAWAGGRVAVRLGQPQVVGELVAGLALGPSLLGAVAPGVSRTLFTGPVVSDLQAVAEVGLVLFMFLVGLEFDTGELRGQGRRAAVISLSSVAVPFAVGVAIAPWFHRTTGDPSDLAAFTIFIGAAMSITAFPVLVRILQDLGLAGGRLGTLVVACAAIDDVVAWILLTVAVAVARADGATEVVRTVVLAAAFAGVLVAVVRPVLARVGRIALAPAVAGAFLAAWITDEIGVSVILGAFLAGVAVPRGDAAQRLDRLLAPVTRSVLLPVFFVVVGLSTEVGRLDEPVLWIVALAVLVAASVGKFGGAAVAARATGERWPDALSVGALMNARGLTEVVILTIGRELGVLGPSAFTIMVLMAIITTVASGPLVRRFRRGADRLPAG